MVKAIFIDIDGTLLSNNSRKITLRTKQIIEKITQKGILVIITSGRPTKYTQDISEQCLASSYIITSNGATIYDYKQGKVIYNNKISKEACLKLYNMTKQKKIKFIMNLGETRVVIKQKYFDGSEIQLNEEIDKFLDKNDVAQCIIADSDFDKIKSLKVEIEQIEGIKIINQHKSLIDNNFKKEGSIYYDIADMNTSKGNAIKRMCEYLNIDLKDTIAIGDSFNDISMFEVVGYSVTMENAMEEVKRYANEVTKSDKEDGVAIFLEKLEKNFK